MHAYNESMVGQNERHSMVTYETDGYHAICLYTRLRRKVHVDRTMLYLSRLSYVQGSNDLECLTHGGDDGSRPVDDPGHRAQGTRSRKLGVSGKVDRHGGRDNVVGPERVNKAIEIETKGVHGGQRNCRKTAANEKVVLGEIFGVCKWH